VTAPATAGPSTLEAQAVNYPNAYAVFATITVGLAGLAFTPADLPLGLLLLGLGAGGLVITLNVADPR
jgi:cyanate permease